MGGRFKFRRISFDFNLEVIVSFLRVKVIGENPPPTHLSFSTTNIQSFGTSIFSALFKSSAIICLRLSPPPPPETSGKEMQAMQFVHRLFICLHP